MIKISTFDICAFILLAILFIATYFRGLTRGKTNQAFILIITSCIFSCFFDILAIYTDAVHDPALHVFQVINHTGYLYFHNLTAPLYFYYVISQTDTFHKFGRNRAEVYFLIIPAIFYTVVMSVNLFTGMVFTITDGYYHRGWFMSILYIIAAVICLLSVIYLLVYRHLFSKTKLVAMIMTVPMLFAAIVVQLIRRDLRIEMFALALGQLFIALFIQRPEALIDYNTGIYKFNAYAMDMKRNFSNIKPIDIIMINIANYLSIQEILSYDAANAMLRGVSDRIKAICKQTKNSADIYYLDKGRFCIVIDRSNHSKTEYTAEAVNAALKPKLPINGMEVNLVPYVCIANCPEDMGDFNTIIEFGKELSTKFRFTGKVLYASDLLDKKKYDLISNLDKIINDAIINKKFEVYYQPIYSVEEGKFRSAEALIRLYNDKYGFISPELFIPVTEKTGAILKLGMFVFEEVCKFIASDDFKDLGLDYIEVNLSVVQCMQGGLAGDLLRIMKKYGVSPDQINLEITESADTQTQSIIAENITALLNAGLTFSLDDFGTGYSNMQRMASLPLKIVKLDKTFTNFHNNPRLLIVLQNTVKMLKSMGMEIVVEGVETQDLVDRFTMLNCEYIQGFFYSRPIPKNEFIDFIRNENSDDLIFVTAEKRA